MTYMNQRDGTCGRDYSLRHPPTARFHHCPSQGGGPGAAGREVGSQRIGSLILPSSEQELYCEEGMGPNTGSSFLLSLPPFPPRLPHKSYQKKEQSRLEITQYPLPHRLFLCFLWLLLAGRNRRSAVVFLHEAPSKLLVQNLQRQIYI